LKKKSFVGFLKGFLTSWIERLERIETKTPRAKKPAWYRTEFHLPPLGVGIFSALLLYGALWWGENLPLRQSLGLAIIVAILFLLVSLYLVAFHRPIARSDDAVGLLAVVFFTTILWIKIIPFFSDQFVWLSPYATPIGIAPLLTTLLLRPRLAVVMAFVVALLFGVVNDFSLELTLIGAFGGVTFVAAGHRSRTTHDVARAGFLAGLVQLLIVLFIAVNRDWAQQEIWIRMTSSFVSGILAAFFSLGALPYLESFFSHTSNLRLLELADVNHPLLKKMSMEAPGTYHHSLMVASLAEDAANAIGANGLLCRVGAYFHDVGKMVKAEYFIENQGTLGNPHDQVSPSLSKLVITSHVKEGIALAQAQNLDPQVVNFIPQHHGTSQIEFFYQKALKLEENEDETDKEDIKEETYRYPGPKPQTKETGIVMMADSVEAASRSLEEPNHQRYKDLVYKIVNKKLFDGQLEETSLTLKDLHQISERFTATLVSLHHNRVAYPEMDPKTKGSSKEKLTPP